MSPEATGILLAVAAGACTTLGGACVFFVRSLSRLPLAVCMAVSAGVMGYVSFIEIFPESLESIREGLELKGNCIGEKCRSRAYILSTVCLFAGWFFASLVDLVIEKLLNCCRYDLPQHSSTTISSHSVTPENSSASFSPSQQPHHHKNDEPMIINSASSNRRRTTAHQHHHHDAPAAAGAQHLSSTTSSTTRLAAVEIENNNVSTSPSSVVSDNSSVAAASSSRRLRSSTPAVAAAASRGLQSHYSSCLKRLKSVCAFWNVKRSPSNIWQLEHAEECFQRDNHKFLKMGVFTAVALTLHNLPEGMATFSGSLSSPQVGASIAIGIGIHNIPEGFAVSVPLYYGSGKKWSSFMYSVLTGFAEPVGALMAWGVLGNNRDPLILGIIFGVVAGIMINISFSELLPSAIKYDPLNQVTTTSFLFGMVVMAVSLLLFQI